MKREESPKKAKKKQRETQKNEQQKMPFLGEKQVCFSIFKKNKKQKNTKNKEGLWPSEVALWATSPEP